MMPSARLAAYEAGRLRSSPAMASSSVHTVRKDTQMVGVVISTSGDEAAMLRALIYRVRDVTADNVGHDPQPTAEELEAAGRDLTTISKLQRLTEQGGADCDGDMLQLLELERRYLRECIEDDEDEQRKQDERALSACEALLARMAENGGDA
jgi:hypothetical protein